MGPQGPPQRAKSCRPSPYSPPSLPLRQLDQRFPSQTFRTLFMQELVRNGVIAPSFVVSYSHSGKDIDDTLRAADAALRAYRLALERGPERMLSGRPVKPVFRRYA